MDKIRVSDDSSDRKYFTIIPNYIANHSTANDQALYFQLKKHAGEDGECYVSQKTLMEKLGIGDKALKKSFEYLLSHNWIKFSGYKEVQTSGGMQKIKSYRIVDIWKLNVEHYEKSQGSSKSVPLAPKGLPKVAQGSSESHQRGSLSADKEEPILNKKKEEEISLEEINKIQKKKEEIRKMLKISS